MDSHPGGVLVPGSPEDGGGKGRSSVQWTVIQEESSYQVALRMGEGRGRRSVQWTVIQEKSLYQPGSPPRWRQGGKGRRGGVGGSVCCTVIQGESSHHVALNEGGRERRQQLLAPVTTVF